MYKQKNIKYKRKKTIKKGGQTGFQKVVRPTSTITRGLQKTARGLKSTRGLQRGLQKTAQSSRYGRPFRNGLQRLSEKTGRIIKPSKQILYNTGDMFGKALKNTSSELLKNQTIKYTKKHSAYNQYKRMMHN